jgi:iron complex outermembrane receptor protein
MTKNRLTYAPLYPVIACCLSFGPALLAAPASAQSAAPAPEQTSVLDEIIVTAQKRSQSQNDVGLSITAASGEELTQLGVQDVGGLAKITPGLTFTQSQDGTPLFTVRGVGFNDYTLGASPAVSVYVDQIPLAYGSFTQGATLDLQRVEVLKGPQGILFGQNSTGGAINYIANKPTAAFEAGVTASYGTFDTFEGSAYVSGPISDTVGARLAVSTTQSGPWQKSYTRAAQLGDQDVLRGRFLLEWKPSDKFNLLFSLNGWKDQSDTQAGQLVGLKLQQDASAPGLYDPVETIRRVNAFRAYPLAPNNARAADWDIGRDLSRDDDFLQAAITAEWALTDSITLTSLTAVSKYNQNYGVDRDGTTLQNAGADSRGDVKSFSQELRLSGDTDRLNWVVGANYASNDVTSADTFYVGDSTNTAIIPGGPWIEAATTTITQDITDTAVFGNVEFALTDKLTILGGARYTESDNKYTGCMRGAPGHRLTFGVLSDVLSGTPGPVPTADTCVNLNPTTFELILTPHEDQLKEDNVSYRFGVNYEPNSDLLFYALTARGYKSGSFPTVPASTTAQLTPVTQESVTAYEAGAKITALNRTLQFNAAVFHYIYKDKQFRGIVLDQVFNQLEQLRNIPEATINGAEFEATARPIDGLTLRLGVTYVDSEVKEFVGLNNDRVFADYAGSELPFSPKWHAVADVSYEWNLSNGLGAFVGGNVLYNSATNSTLGDPASSEITAFTTLDLRAGVRAADGRWSLFAWGRNVTDEYYWTNQFVTQDVITRYAAKPATWGVTLSYDF